MIRLQEVTFTHAGAGRPVLTDVDLTIDEGELVLVMGPTGSGKSTLLGLLNGLVPHSSGGRLAGRVTVAGRDTRTTPPRELADIIGVVPQDPVSGFVTDSVEEELAYAMEQLGVSPTTMRKRVEDTLDLLGIAELRHRALGALSGGQQQRVAIGAALTAHPAALVLDEPTSALDPMAAEEVLAAVTRLVSDIGTTVVMAEHRLERVVQFADSAIVVPGGGSVVHLPTAEALAVSPVAPPVVQLGRALGWAPLPLSVRDARRVAIPVRDRLAHLAPPVTPPATGDDVLVAEEVIVRHGSVLAVDRVSLSLREGEVVALMGRNGSGKSSLLWALQGTGTRYAGRLRVRTASSASSGSTSSDSSISASRGASRKAPVAGSRRAATSTSADPATLPAGERRRLVGLVPQTASDLLYLATVDAECSAADTEAHVPAGTCRGLLERLAPGIAGDMHPRDLSEGQKLALVLAVQLTAAPPVMLLDEPTRGLDYRGKRELQAILADLAARGVAVVVATHDVEFAAASTTRTVVMGDGEVVADGPTREVVASSPGFAPQVAKIVAPQPFLTVDEVVAALAEPEMQEGV